ncbi:MAG: hypothetical protein HZC12_02460 [Nitrospirae bacterium]|nr:hypothetical protein [Nitrospirota bacterium]
MVYFLALFLLFSFAAPSHGQVSVGISVDDAGSSFYLAIGSYYKVEPATVVVVRERRVPDDEIPVVFFLAQRAKVDPGIIVAWRLENKSWMDITIRLGLSPEIYYVPLPRTVVLGPPYGKAYGYYKNKPKKQWHRISLEDRDVINLVNLRFITQHYGYSPEEVIKWRGKGEGFREIALKAKEKHDKGKAGEKEEKEKHKKGKGKHKED